MLKPKCFSFLRRRTNFLISWQRFGRCVLWFWLRVTGSTSWKGSSPALRMEKCEGTEKHITTHSLTQIQKASLKGYGKCSSINVAQRYKDIIELWALSVHFGFKCTDNNILNSAHFVLLIGLLHQVLTSVTADFEVWIWFGQYLHKHASFNWKADLMISCSLSIYKCFCLMKVVWILKPSGNVIIQYAELIAFFH